MTDEKHDDHDGAPAADSAQDGQRRDEASGQKVGPPGQGDRDEAAIEEGLDKLGQAGGGH